MRKYLGSLVFVGYALIATPLSAAPSVNEASGVDADPTVAVHQVRVPGTGRRDQAAMVLVGTALIGLGAAVRRAA
jgi:hypothetical protein